MDNREYLNEEKYQKSVKGLRKASLIVLIVGVLIGLSLIVTGIILYNADKSTIVGDAEKITNKITYTKEEKEEFKKEYAEIKKEITKLEAELKKLENDKDSILKNFSTSTNMNDVNDIINAITEKTKELAEDNSEKAILETKIYGKAKAKIIKEEEDESFLNLFNNIGKQMDKNYKLAKYSPFFGFGGFIIFTSLIISGFLYFISKRREITAFSVQQTMPVAKEAASEMAPTAKEVSKEIAEGIKEGLEEKE